MNHHKQRRRSSVVEMSHSYEVGLIGDSQVDDTNSTLLRSCQGNDDHYELYSRMERIDRVSLAEYGPEGLLWYPWVLLTVFLTRYSAPRPDHLFEGVYWKNHYKFYMLLWCLWLSTITLPLVFSCEAGYCTTYPVVETIMLISWFLAFPVSWGLLYHRALFMSWFPSKAKGLQAWTFVLWFGWWTQGVAYVAIALLPFEPAFIPVWIYEHPAFIVACVIVAVVGSGIKMYCAFLSGLNNYYYYDMMLDTPNARFVNSSLYSVFSSPTYHVGYIDGYGFALLTGYLHRGNPLLAFLFTLINHITIYIVNELVEQPAVRGMYKTADDSTTSSPSSSVEVA